VPPETHGNVHRGNQAPKWHSIASVACSGSYDSIRHKKTIRIVVSIHKERIKMLSIDALDPRKNSGEAHGEEGQATNFMLIFGKREHSLAKAVAVHAT
jgi:hypothetical protein